MKVLLRLLVGLLLISIPVYVYSDVEEAVDSFENDTLSQCIQQNAEDCIHATCTAMPGQTCLNRCQLDAQAKCQVLQTQD